jgi:hypothetical protein
MANKIVEQKLIDTTKRALLKYVIIGDGSAIANNVLVDVSNLAYALNTTGQIMTSNTNLKPIYRTTIKHILGHVGGAATTGIKLNWHRAAANAEVEICAMAGGSSFEFNFDSIGGGVIINAEQNPIGSNGDILISTIGTGSPLAVTLFIDLHKDNGDYDAGQTAAPKDFNR